MDAGIIRFGVEQLTEQGGGLGGAIGALVQIGHLKIQGAGFAHHALLNIEIGQALERANLFRSEFSDFFVDGDGFGEEAIGEIDLGEAFEVFKGLKGLALANEQIADGHEGDLILGVVLEDGQVLGNRLGNLALVEILLGRFDVLGLLVCHACSGRLPAEGDPKTCRTGTVRTKITLARSGNGGQ